MKLVLDGVDVRDDALRRVPGDAAKDAVLLGEVVIDPSEIEVVVDGLRDALAFGEGAQATAPLGRAVIGGLAASTFATLLVLPSVYSLVQQSASTRSASLDPDDRQSVYHVQESI